MTSQGRVISQADIDSMVAASSGWGPKAQHDAVSSRESREVYVFSADPSPEPRFSKEEEGGDAGVTPTGLTEGNAQMAEVVERLAQLEEAVLQLSRAYGSLVEAVGSSGGAAGSTPQLEEMQGTLQSLVEVLKNSLGCNAHSQFVCGSCGQKGFVASPIRCTQCGDETLWGWWPRSG